MSRGFVKEEDQEDNPMVPPRADLPQGITNYVTPIGMELLLKEREELISQKNIENNINENERRIAINFINAKLQLLNERIATAKIVEFNGKSEDEIHFGAYITLKVNDQKQPQSYQIVGVDEANISQRKIAFISPIAKLLMDKKVGEEAVLQLQNKKRILQILSIKYDLK